MRSRVAVCMILCLSVLLVRPSHAITGNDVLTVMCKDAQHRRCRGFYAGVLEGIFAASSFVATMHTGVQVGWTQALGLCIPDAVTRSQLTEIAIEYLRRNPAVTHEQAAGLAIVAWNDAFACE